MISIIIPALNEAHTIAAMLEHTSALPGNREIILVDGGSHDQTVQIACGIPGVCVTHSSAGRSVQMNAGAAIAHGEWLLFLHADTLLPENALQLIAQLGKKQYVQAGGFLHQFSDNDWRLRLISRLNNYRCRNSKIIFGDQALFIRRTLFSKLGGFPEQDILEDVALSQAINQVTTPCLLDTPVVTSSRKFIQQGILKSFLRCAWILTQLRLGLQVAKTNPFFRPVR